MCDLKLNLKKTSPATPRVYHLWVLAVMTEPQIVQLMVLCVQLPQHLFGILSVEVNVSF